MTCFLLGWWWLNCHQEKEQFEANDIKYRSLKIRGVGSMIKCCYLTDSLYQKDRVGFSNDVEQEERRIIEQAELLRFAGERERKPRP